MTDGQVRSALFLVQRPGAPGLAVFETWERCTRRQGRISALEVRGHYLSFLRQPDFAVVVFAAVRAPGSNGLQQRYSVQQAARNRFNQNQLRDNYPAHTYTAVSGERTYAGDIQKRYTDVQRCATVCNGMSRRGRDSNSHSVSEHGTLGL